MATEPSKTLTTGEQAVLEALVLTNGTNGVIGRELGISVNTVKTHLRNINKKLGTKTRTEAIMLCHYIRGTTIVVPYPTTAHVIQSAEVEP